MRWRSMALAGAAVLAAVQVCEVLTATRLWRFSELGAYALLAVAVRTEPRWLGPVLLAPLLLDALLTLPPVGPRTYGWQVVSGSPEINPGIDALDQGFRQGGAVVIFMLALHLTTRRRWAVGRAVIAALLGLAIAGYAVARVVVAGSGLGVSSVVALALAVVVPVLLAVAALAFAAAAGGRLAPLGGVLVAAAALPMIDTMIGRVPVPFAHFTTGLFGWDAITPTVTLPQPVAAIEEGLLLAGVICALVRARFKPSGG